jgi:FkbM family methyltransferase
LDDTSFNAEALAKRALLPRYSTFNLKELSALPLYFGWVDCDSGHGKFKMLAGGHDDAVALRFFWNGSYEKTTLELWARLTKKFELAVDIGAHTGVYTLAAKAANPEISVIAFEPSYLGFGRLNLNMRVNRLHTQNAFLNAVGIKNETIPFSILMPMDYLSTGNALGARKGAHVVPVQVVSLDTFLPDAFKQKVGLVKIDTEGYESAVIAGMATTLSVARPVVFFECIDAGVGAAVQKQLEFFGYRFFEVDDIAETLTAVETIKPYFDAANKVIYSRVNRIAVPKDRELPWQ